MGFVENQYNATGIKIGFWVENYSNGKPIRKGYYDFGVMVGQWKFFYYTEERLVKSKKHFKEELARLDSVGYYKQGMRVDCWKYYSKFGQLKEEIIFIK